MPVIWQGFQFGDFWPKILCYDNPEITTTYFIIEILFWIFEIPNYEKNGTLKMYFIRTKCHREAKPLSVYYFRRPIFEKKKFGAKPPPGKTEVRYLRNRCFTEKSSLVTGLAKTVAFSCLFWCFLRYRQKNYTMYLPYEAAGSDTSDFKT